MSAVKKLVKYVFLGSFNFLLVFGLLWAASTQSSTNFSPNEDPGSTKSIQQYVDARPATRPCYRGGKSGKVWYFEYGDAEKVDPECQKLESVRLVPEGMEAQARHLWCSTQVAVGAFVDIPTCMNYTPNQASEVAKNAAIVREHNNFCSQEKPKWYKPLRRAKYKRKCS